LPLLPMRFSKAPLPVIAIVSSLTLVPPLNQSVHAQNVLSASGSGVVSPSVVVTSIVESLSPDRARLQLLVMWRGTAGWMMAQGRGQAARGGGRGGPRPEDDTPMLIQASYGGVTLDLSFRAGAHKLTISGKNVPLDPQDNVVLVDQVNSPGGPKVIGTLHIGPDATPSSRPSGDSFVPPQEFIRRSPVLIKYLRCDVPFSHPNGAIQYDMKVKCQEFR
jgi:hypothetical protein